MNRGDLRSFSLQISALFCALLFGGFSILVVYAQPPQLGAQQLQRILELERQHRPHVAIPAERVIAAFRAAGLDVTHVQQAPAVATGGDYAVSGWVRSGTSGVGFAVYEFASKAKIERFRQVMETTRSLNPNTDVGDYAINRTTALQVMSVGSKEQGSLRLRQRLLDIFRKLEP